MANLIFLASNCFQVVLQQFIRGLRIACRETQSLRTGGLKHVPRSSPSFSVFCLSVASDEKNRSELDVQNLEDGEGCTPLELWKKSCACVNRNEKEDHTLACLRSPWRTRIHNRSRDSSHSSSTVDDDDAKRKRPFHAQARPACRFTNWRSTSSKLLHTAASVAVYAADLGETMDTIRKWVLAR